MRALDPRLLRPTRSARPLMANDVVLGVGTALAVLPQGTMLAWIAARAVASTPFPALAQEFELLVIAFLLRDALAWAMKVAARHAACSVLSELRSALIDKRLRTQPSAPDGAGSTEITTVSVRRRIVPAPAFARDAPFVILDDPTAHLDPGTASDLVHDMFAAVSDQTALLITHRSEGLELVDRMVAL